MPRTSARVPCGRLQGAAEEWGGTRTVAVKLQDGCRVLAELILRIQKQKVCCRPQVLALHPAGTSGLPCGSMAQAALAP